MTSKPKLLLGLSIVLLVAGVFIATGWVNVQKVPSLNVVLPVGVILAGVFLVGLLFDKESKAAEADEQVQAMGDAGAAAARDKAREKRASAISG